jgi:hypothetical protein
MTVFQLKAPTKKSVCQERQGVPDNLNVLPNIFSILAKQKKYFFPRERKMGR